MSLEEIKITVTSEISKVRIDVFLQDHPDVALTRSKIQKLISENQITVNGEAISKNYKVEENDQIIILVAPTEPSDITGEKIPIEIVFEDDHLAVINKPAGMVTHPGAGNFSGTLVNALIYHFEKLPASSPVDRPGIVHRLDKNTSGLLIIAKTDETLTALQEAIQKREVKRIYKALICGHLPNEKGAIDLPIGRSIKDRKKMTVTNLNSREAVTDYEVIDTFRSYQLLQLSLRTGRTHQIRVHLAHQGHPVFGDPEYGGRDKWHKGIFGPERPLAKALLEKFDRQALHAARIELTHPVTGEDLHFEADLPADFKLILELLDAEGR